MEAAIVIYTTSERPYPSEEADFRRYHLLVEANKFQRAQISTLIISTLLMCYKANAIHLSLIRMLPLMDTEEIMINTLERYIQAENQKLESLKQFNDIRKGRQDPTMDTDEFASNLLAVFSMTRYLTTDFKELQKRMTGNNYDSTISVASQTLETALPSLDDYHSVILNLVNLQRVYDIEINDLMNGSIFNGTSNTTLSVDDCIEIGKVCSYYNDHAAAVQWVTACVNLIPEDDLEPQTPLWNLLSASFLYLGEKENAITCIDNYLSTTTHRHQNKDNLKRLLCADLNDWDRCGTWSGVEDTAYHLCRGDFSDEVLTWNLKCRYNHSNGPFLILAPLKEEELSINPKIVLYRDVLYDSEIEILKTEARNVLADAEVLNKDQVTFDLDLQYRPSQTGFLDNYEPQYQTMNERLQDLSGLSLDYSEMFQMLNYAPGGYYRVHTDNLPRHLDDIAMRGQRVATALFYLNDVPLGGGTVFPRLKLHVQPVKGSVLFWINILEDGTAESNVAHAACPVIYGEKWACTQWFREEGQSLWISMRLRDSLFRWDPTESSKYWQG